MKTTIRLSTGEVIHDGLDLPWLGGATSVWIDADRYPDNYGPASQPPMVTLDLTDPTTPHQVVSIMVRTLNPKPFDPADVRVGSWSTK